MITRRIEFIDEYAQYDGDLDWHYNDNHGVLVRCKDCSHVYYADNRVPSEQNLVCDLTGRNVTPDWFCADGERMDGGEDVDVGEKASAD